MPPLEPWPPNRPELAPSQDLTLAERWLKSYRPDDAGQADIRQQFLAFIAQYPRHAHLRACRPGHLTASALVLDTAGRRVLLTHHRKLDRWLQPGGHCDGDANLPAVALKEAIEESGIIRLVVYPRIVDLDIHAIPARSGEPAHLHYDSRFLVRATEDAEPVVGPESHDVRWWELDALEGLDPDPSLERLYACIPNHAA